MSSGGKSGSSQQSLNYYGTLAGALCWGPLDWLTAIICNGNYIWQCSSSGPLQLAGAVNAQGFVDFSGWLLDHTLLVNGGYFRLYIGAPNQQQDPALAGHPPYLDTAYFVATNIFFGENSGTAPNFQFIGGRTPRVPTTIVAAADNILSDRQINPVAVLVEILLDERGAGLPLALLDPASWTAAAHWCAQDAAHQLFTFVSPLVTEQSPLRDLVRELLEPFNGFLAWTPAGTLGCYVYKWGTNPGGLPLVDARYISQKPKFSDGDWTDIPTEAMVSFTDRAYEFQDNSVLVPNARAAQIRGIDDQVQLDRKHVTRQAQAQQQGQEFLHRKALAPGTATVVARGPIVGQLLPGAKILVDTEPEPGGSGLAQLARVEKIDTDRTDEVTLELTLDPLLPAQAYTPNWISPLPETTFAANVQTCAPIPHLLTIPLPPAAWGWPPAIAVLATRPDTTVVGFAVLFGTSTGGAFAELGVQTGFAARMNIVNPIGSGDGTIRLQLADGVNGPDSYIAGNTPGGNTSAAQDDALLCVIAQLDGSGRVADDGNGNPLIELCSILQRSAVTSDTHDYTVYRGRRGTAAAAWATTCAAWIIPLNSIAPWRHNLFVSLIGQTLYVRAVAYNLGVSDDSTPVPESDLVLPGAYAALATVLGNGDPTVGGTGLTGPLGVVPNAITAVTLTPGLGMLALGWTNPTNVGVRQVLIYVSATNVQPAQPTASVLSPQTFFFLQNLAASSTWYFWLQVEGVNGLNSAVSGPFSATTRAGVNLSDLVPGLEMVGIVSALPNPVGYTGPKNVLLTSDLKLYRYNSATPAWTRQVDGNDLVANSIIAGALAAGAVTATAVGANQIITQTANIANGIITSAQIVSLVADKIATGNLKAVMLQASQIADNVSIYNTDDSTRFFPTTSHVHDQINGSANTTVTDDGQAHYFTTNNLIFTGWQDGATGFLDTRCGNPDLRMDLMVAGGVSFVSPGPNTYLQIGPAWRTRTNGGAWGSWQSPGWVDALPPNQTTIAAPFPVSQDAALTGNMDLQIGIRLQLANGGPGISAYIANGGDIWARIYNF